METIYIDVLLILNIYVNYFLLRISAVLTHSYIKTGRCILASVYGSLFSLMILAPPLNFAVTLFIKVAAAFTVVLAGFGFFGMKRALINSAAFFTANFILAGSVYAVYSLFSPRLMHYNNASFYIDFSIIILILTTSALYFIVRMLRPLLDKTPENCECYRVIIRYKQKIVALKGLADTGNALVDFFTGAPVIVCGGENFGIDLHERLPKGFRLLPCSTISDSGLLPVFRPDEVLIECTENGERKPVDAVIGLGKCSEKAIFNPKLLKI